MFVAVYASALVIAGRELVSIHDTQRRNGFSLLCVGLTGLGVLPQALHRADLQHLLQVAPPFVLALAALAARLADRTTPHNAPLRLAGIIGCVVAVALIVAAAPHASFDLASAWRNPVRYWRTISGLPESRGDEPVADMAVAIERLTPPDANVFLLMSTSRMPLLFFAQRHQPGLFPVYEAGMFSGPTWLAHNRIALEQTPPDYLVVPEPGTTRLGRGAGAFHAGPDFLLAAAIHQDAACQRALSTAGAQRAALDSGRANDQAQNHHPWVAAVQHLPVRRRQPTVRCHRHMLQRHRVIHVATNHADLARYRGIHHDVAVPREMPGRQVVEAQVTRTAAAEADQVTRLRRIRIRTFGGDQPSRCLSGCLLSAMSM